MGKTQSKRSVDITTEISKDGLATEENTGKLGKIEDAEPQLKPQLNGDSNHKDADAPEQEVKVAKDEAENEKDNVPEKKVESEDKNGSGDAKIEEASPVVVVENGVAATENEGADTTTETLDESKVSEVIEATEQGTDAAATDSNKKPKKEKTKKRWSFRSFSFSKKDKQKPEKRKNAEDAAANESTAAVTNGDCEKVVEETVEQTVAVTEKVAETVEPVVNGASETVNDAETKAEIQSAPVAIPASDEKPSAPIADETKPIEELKEVVEQTIELAVKSVEDKINVVPQAEVNDDKDSEAIAPSIEKIENNEVSSVEPVSNINDNSASLGDISTNNNPPPPLPENPPPSQASVFAENAMAVEHEQNLMPAPAHPQPCPIITTNVQSDSVLIGNTKLEIISVAKSVVDEVLADAKNDVEEKIESVPEQVSAEPEVVPTVADPVAQPEEIAETIAILDNINVTESQEPLPEPLPVQDVPEPLPNQTIADITIETNKDDLSNDISSPLQQNSLESLPSPQSLSSETEQNVELESTSAVDELKTNDPIVDAAVESAETNVQELPSVDSTVQSVVENVNENKANNEIVVANIETDNSDLKPIQSNESDIKVNDDSVAVDPATPVPDVEANGQHTEAIPSADAPTTNGGCAKSNGTTLKSEKENGVEKSSVEEKPAEISTNGDSVHKTIDEIVPSPEKLEKAGVQPTITETVTAE